MKHTSAIIKCHQRGYFFIWKYWSLHSTCNHSMQTHTHSETSQRRMCEIWTQGCVCHVCVWMSLARRWSDSSSVVWYLRLHSHRGHTEIFSPDRNRSGLDLINVDHTHVGRHCVSVRVVLIFLSGFYCRTNELWTGCNSFKLYVNVTTSHKFMKIADDEYAWVFCTHTAV